MQLSLEEQALLGDDAKRFTEVYEYLFDRAQDDADAALEDLANIKPYEFDTLEKLQAKITEHQTAIARCHNLNNYIKEAIVQGDQALQQLEIEE